MARFIRPLLTTALWCASLQAGTIVNFDDGQAPSNTKPGNAYAASGITFSTVSIPANLIVGDIFTPASLFSTFWLINNSNAVSEPGFAAATNGGTNDLWMTFSPGITSLSLHTDDTGEAPQIVRLLALADAGGGQFQVLAIASGWDDATAEPGNLLSVTNGGTGFSYAVFEATTEQEGIDDITFQPVPEPSTFALLFLGGACLIHRRRRSAR